MKRKTTITNSKKSKTDCLINTTAENLFDLNSYERDLFQKAVNQLAAARRRYKKFIAKKRRALQLAHYVGEPLKKFFTIGDE